MLTTPLDSHALLTHLGTIERRYGAGRSGLAALGFDVIRIVPDGEAVGTLADALPARVSGTTTRIEGTASRTMPEALNYDAPGGAGSRYDEVRPRSSFSQKLFSAAADAIQLRPSMKVLDVGCGTGRFSVLFAQRGAVVTGIDRSTTMLTAARASLPPGLRATLHYIQADANHGLPKDNFDAGVFFMSIQYISLSDAFFNALHEALAPNGIVAVVTLPHRHFIENEFLTRYFPSIPHIDLARFPSIPQLERLLREHGFGDVSTRDIIDVSESSGAALISNVERKFVSTLHLIEAAEFERGLAAMRADISGRAVVRRRMHAAVVCARARPAPSMRRNIKRGGTQEGSP